MQSKIMLTRPAEQTQRAGYNAESDHAYKTSRADSIYSGTYCRVRSCTRPAEPTQTEGHDKEEIMLIRKAGSRGEI